MKCKKCKKECMESELTNGYCYSCYQESKGNIEELKTIKNDTAEKIKKTSNVIKILGYIGSLILLFLFIYLYNFTNGLIVGILTAFSIFITTILLDGFAEIIQLLENIKNK